MQEARRLFSPMDDQYAFGETDEQGRDNLAHFRKQHDVRFDIMPTEGRSISGAAPDNVEGALRGPHIDCAKWVSRKSRTERLVMRCHCRCAPGVNRP
jgi:hypothetical protein